MFKPIMSPSAEGDNNGGTTAAENGSQGSQPTNDEQSSKTEEQASKAPSFATVEQLNRALTSYNKRLEGQVEKKLQEAMNPLMEMLQAMKTAEEDKAGKSDTLEKQGEQSNKEVLKLQNQMQELQTMLERERNEKQEANQRAVESRLKSEVLRTLSELKVEKAEQVYQLVRDALIIDEPSGRVTVRVIDPKLGFEDEKDLKAGLTDWLLTEGSHFMPPKPVTGSGAASSSGGVTMNKAFNVGEFMKMKPSEAAQVDLRKALGDDIVDAFFGKK